MNKVEIINCLAKNDRLKRVAHNIAGGKGLGDDLYQHLFLVLLEYDEAKIIRAQENKYIEYTCIKIMANSYNSKSSPFAHQYRQHLNDVELTFDIEYIEDEPIPDKKEPIEQFLEQPINTTNFYHLTLLKRWAKGESYKTLAKKTKIPQRSIEHAVRKGINEIKQIIK